MPGSMSSSDPPLARDAANTAMKPASPVVGLPRMATLPLYSEPSSSLKLVGHFFTASVSQPMAIVPPRWLYQVPSFDFILSGRSSAVAGWYSARRPSSSASTAKDSPVDRKSHV